MKQILLRMPEETHRKLVAHAARDGRSVNAIASEILPAIANEDLGRWQASVHARAASLGLLHRVPAQAATPAQRSRVIATTEGVGLQVNDRITRSRERL